MRIYYVFCILGIKQKYLNIFSVLYKYMLNLDKFDKKLLYELDLNARQTNKQLARKVKLSEQAIAYRIEKLQKNGVIEEFVLMVNPGKLGYTHYKIYLRLQNIPTEEEKLFLDFLKKEDGVFWVVSARGNYDYIISFSSKTLNDYKIFYYNLKNKFGQYIYSEDLVLPIKAPLFNRSYFVENSKKLEVIYGGKQVIEEIDNKDKKIISALAHNARLSYLEVGKKTKIKPDTVRNHYKKLVANGVIIGTRLKLNVKKIDRNYNIIFFTLQNFNEKNLRDMEVFAQGHAPIIYYINCIGSHNVELEIETINDDETDFIIKSFRDYFFKYIKNYSVLTVKEEIKLKIVPF